MVKKAKNILEFEVKKSNDKYEYLKITLILSIPIETKR